MFPDIGFDKLRLAAADVLKLLYMRIILLLLMTGLVLQACRSGDQYVENQHEKSVGIAALTAADSIATTEIVRSFFAAFDEKDTAKLAATLIPETQIIHHNGTVTNTQQLIQVINKTKNWWPRKRQISDFEFIAADSIAVLGFFNEVVFELPGNKSIKEPYRETWIFKRTDSGWQPVRIHYSKITVDKHSEEVTE